MMHIENTAWQIEWIYTIEFPGRPVPLVILQDGKPGYVINQWVYWLLEEGVTPSTLEQHIRSVMQLYEFCYRKYGNESLNETQSLNLISDFLEAKRKGSQLLGWKPNRRSSTLKKYLHSINLFDKWNTTFNKALHLNPNEECFMTRYQVNLKFRQRKKFDLLIHLHPAKIHKQKVYKYNVKIDHQRFCVDSHIIPKAFPVEMFVPLIEATRNPRDQMLWLLMAGGSLRQSETLHLFYEDVLGINKDGVPRIRLADPETGIISWYKDGRQVTGNRLQYMEDCFRNEIFKKTRPDLFQIMPRTMGKRGRDHAGFKGMTFSDSGESCIIDGRYTTWNELFWIEPAFGYRFQKAYQEYVSDNFFNKPGGWPWHPWLFITQVKTLYGTPLTLQAIRSAWKTALTRIGLGNSGLSPHSLRHMYGAYCASVLQLPLEMTRTLMHHASVSSTQVYYHLRSADVRNAITEAILNRLQTEEFKYLIMPSAPRLNVPESWNQL
jgi:integrase